MKTRTLNNNLKTRTFGLLIAAMAPTAALADHYDHAHRTRGAEVTGTVVLSKEIPGGVITVGATIGKPRPEVVVVEDRRPDVVVVKERAPQKVVIIEKEPVREKVIIVKERPVEKKVVIIEKHGRCGKKVKKIVYLEDGHRHHGRGHGRDWDDDRGHRRDRDWDGRNHAQQVSIQHQDGHGNSHYYRDANQVSQSYSGPEGNYHYYEDANQVSIQDNRDGQNRHVYVRK